MTNNRHDALFELPADSGGEPFQRSGLGRQTNFQGRASRAGADFKAMAISRLGEAGATIERIDFEINGFPVDALVHGSNGRRFLVLARGTPDEQRASGLRRPDTVEKVGFMAMQLARCQDLPILLLTSDLPKRSTKTGHYLAALSLDVWDVVSYRSDLRGFQRLRSHLGGPIDAEPPAAPWRLREARPQRALFDEALEPNTEDEAT